MTKVNFLSSWYISIRNSMHPGYGSCSMCGANWGWKKSVTHSTSDSSGVFLFFVDCDKKVTPEQRWMALAEWKIMCIGQIMDASVIDLEDRERHAKHIRETEFVEFPRERG